jgi:methylthioribose-1-phosphate isomerase
VDIIRSVQWSDDGLGVRIIDQRELPGRFVERDLRTVDEVCDAIRTLAVRGAPAIGIAGAIGLVAVLSREHHESRDALLSRTGDLARTIGATRPTAVNLGWALDRMQRHAMATSGGVPEILAALRSDATAILEEDREMCRRIGEHGARLIRDGNRIITHCNAGALATAGIGTALAAIYVAAERGMRVSVYADETRPLLQGSRLTAWELARAGIPATVIVDSAAASLMRSNQVDLCIVGADRIAANGDVANKVGSYALAVAARHHGIPFYVAAPTTTFEPDTPTGADIVVEQRAAGEVAPHFADSNGSRPVSVHNPAFDITPAHLITAIVSDMGIHEPPFDFSSLVVLGGRR